MFVDELEIFVKAGHGGGGCISFRREKYVEFGGPDGGNGGDGGSVIVRARPDFNTLLPLRSQKHYRAGRGTHGKGSNMTGACGDSCILDVPVGTIVRDRETGTLIADLTNAGDEVIVAQGGRGGKGNRHFASSTMRTPRFSQPGEPGEELWLRVELKMMADVGLVGFPNAGKSTLISRISSAQPKIADYPFTTLKPGLGVVDAGDFRSFVVADIPGIIKGAHEGAGLGLRFLRHIERTSVLLVLVDPSDTERSIRETYVILQNELQSFSKRLSRKPVIVALTKADVPHEREEEFAEITAEWNREAIPWVQISSVRGDGLDQLVHLLYDKIQETPTENTADWEDEDEDLDIVPESEAAIDPLDEI